MRLPVYLDHAAATPVDAEVAAAMHECLCSPALSANPSAAGHAPGQAAQARVEQARGEVAVLIGARPDEILWTSGATEANNLAILGTARFRAPRGRHLVTALTEHASVREPFRQLEREGFRVSWLKPGPGGLVEPADLARVLLPDTQLVSLMHVNNETGVIQDIAALGALCRERGALFHVDAAQSAGRLAVDLARLPVDLLTLSAHKIYGPKGVGALYLNAATLPWLEPLMHGGRQERGLRPGTVATHQVAGMGVACRLAAARMAEDAVRLRALRDALWDGLREIPGVLLNGDPERRAHHILSVSVEGVCGESLLFALAGDLALSAGAACSSDTGEPSQVLRSLGRSRLLAESSLRFSVGRHSTAAEIALAVAAAGRAVADLRRMRPRATGPAA